MSEETLAAWGTREGASRTDTANDGLGEADASNDLSRQAGGHC